MLEPRIISLGTGMKHKTEFILLTVSLILGSSLLMADSRNEREEVVALIQKARASADIEAQEVPPLLMRAQVTLFPQKGSPTEGSYLFVRASREQWRRELILPGYQEITVAEQGKVWRASSLHYEPYLIFQVEAALRFYRSLPSGPDWQVRRIREKRLGTTRVKCAELKASSPEGYEVCADPISGNLLRELDQTWDVTYEFADYAATAGKMFPHTLRVTQGDHLIAEVKVREIAPAPNLDPMSFVRPNGAKLAGFTDCQNTQRAKLLANPMPHYPGAAKLHGERGTVRLYAEVGGDGQVHGLAVVRSVSPQLDASALESVSQWRYQPTMCNALPVSVVTHIDVRFELP
jgi:TonB family protein